MDFADDLDALSSVGWGPDRVDDLARVGMPEGALAQFLDLTPQDRALVLRLLEAPAEADFAALAALLHGRALAEWVLALPAYQGGYPEEDDG